MSLFLEDADRSVIPRWRTFAASDKLGETHPQSPRQVSPVAESSGLIDRIRDFTETRTPTIAADLISAAHALGPDPIVREAAELVLLQGSATFSGARIVARRLLGIPDTSAHDGQTSESGDLRQLASRLRHHVRVDSADALAWMDLARCFETLGQHQKALSCSQVARALAPADRFLLRSSARLLIHQNDYTAAHDLLQRSPRTTSDTWLLSAEIASAAVAHRVSRNLKRARRILDNAQPSMAISELAAAISTLEFQSGNAKLGRRLASLASVHPTENAVAQLSWLERRFGTDVVRLNRQALGAKSAEAQSWIAQRNEQWDRAFEASKRWLDDQPFSSRPAVCASFTATLVEEFEEGAAIARRGLVANNQDFTLTNNLAYCLAELGKLDEAREALARPGVKDKFDDPRHKIVAHATTGLIAFRSGEVETGRWFYRQAIAAAAILKDDILAAKAKLFLLIEEARSIVGGDVSGCEEAIQQATNLSVPSLKPTIQRLTRYMQLRQLGEQHRRRRRVDPKP